MESSKLKLAEVTKDKSAVRTKISAPLLKSYDALAGKQNGKAVSLVETEFCGVCNVKIRPQRLNELLSFKEMLTCDSCGRILFVKLVKKEEKKKETKNKDKNKSEDK